LTSKQRFIKALHREIPDRLPVTTHHVMRYFLDRAMGGISVQEFFDTFGLDPINWVHASKPEAVDSDEWRVERKVEEHQEFRTVRYRIDTPQKALTMVLQENEYTEWVAEPLIKEKSDMEVFAKYAPVPLCDVEKVNREAEEYGERGMIRGMIPGFDIYGQPGCWQDLAVLYEIEKLILEVFHDPKWVHEALMVFLERKKRYIQSMEGAKFDLVELGGGSASSTVISPAIFEEYVAPYDAELIGIAHQVGQRVVYHTCGGMMPLLERIADMRPDAMETFTPPSLGGDVDLKEAKRRIGDRVCMIGGFDQFHYLTGCSPEDTRKGVRRCFAEAGGGGGYILAPSDHFFEADIECLKAFADEAKRCIYS
jgi:uroporphyrinogen decarboxylase